HWRSRIRASHVDAVFRAARRRAAGGDHGTGRGAYLFVSPARIESKGAAAKTGCRLLAGPGVEGCGCLPGGDGGGVAADCVATRFFAACSSGRGIGRARRSFRTLFRSPTGVVFPFSVSVFEILSRRNRNLGRD